MKRRVHKVTTVKIEKPALSITHVETVCGRVFSVADLWTDVGTRHWQHVTCLACKRMART